MITQELEFHPIADGFPLASPIEFETLQENIREVGLLSPIVLYEGKILDGRNRYMACREAGIDPRFEIFSGTYAEAFRYSNSLNAARRHLTQGQKAMVAARAVLDSRNKQEVKNLSVKVAAEIYGVSDTYIKDAMNLCNLDPVLAEQVFAGHATFKQAEKHYYEQNRETIIQRQEDQGLKMSASSGGFTSEQMQRYRFLDEQEKFSLIKMIMEMEGTIS